MEKYFELIKREVKRTQEIVLVVIIMSILIMQQSSTLERIKSQILMLEGFILGWIVFVLISASYFFVKKNK